MGKDYYKILGVPKEASEDDLKKAYRKLAAKFHPDKVRGSDADKAAATEKFKEVGEAYDVLSDPEKRKVFDMFGEEGLKGGVPPSGAAAGFGGDGMPQGFRGGYQFDNSAAQRIFEQFFGGMGGIGGLGGMGGMGGPGVRIFQSAGGPGGSFSFFNSGGGMDEDGSDEDLRAPGYGGSPYGGGTRFGGGGGFHDFMGGAQGRRGARQPHEHVVDLALSLDQLYTGVKKKLRVTRKIVDGASGQSVPVQEVVELDVKPGWKSGTKITFEGKGDELPGRPAQDLVFKIVEQPHPTFKRVGNDLHTTVKIPLVTALTGGTVNLRHLDTHSVPITLREPVQPGSERLVRGEGMPISKQPGQKGDLHVKFDVEFPQHLTDAQKQAIRRALT